MKKTDRRRTGRCKRGFPARGFPAGVRALVCGILLASPLAAQDSLQDAFSRTLIPPEEAKTQHDEFVLARIARLGTAASAAAWQEEAARIRHRVREEVIFRGVPSAWREGKPAVVWDDVIETEHGYRIRKLRFAALPGLWIPALLYEPTQLDGKVPAVLNVNGHEATGKSIAYKQLRCINLAKRGMLALNLEWIGMGQLRAPGFSHNHLAKLDLCGRAGVSVFCLAQSVTIEAHGPRSSLIARCAAALDGGTIVKEVQTIGEPASLKEYLQPGADYAVTPEVYCFGLLEHFDLPQLIELAGN